LGLGTKGEIGDNGKWEGEEGRGLLANVDEADEEAEAVSPGTGREGRV